MSLLGTNNSLGVWLVLQYLSNGDGLAFVTEGKSTHLLHYVELFHWNWNSWSNSGYYLRVSSGKLWFVLDSFISLFICISGPDNLLHCYLVTPCVDVHHAVVTL